jgi:hypothetical protein
MARDARFNSSGNSRGLADKSTYQPRDDSRMTRSGGADRVDAQVLNKYRRINPVQRESGKRAR